MNALVNAVSWVVGKALAPVTDTVLEDWAASKDLGANVEALKMELLYVQALLGPWSSSRRGEIDRDNPALETLLQILQDKAYQADDVLDELDYFRLQDAIYGTSEAADEHAKGCCHNLCLNSRHTAKAVGKLLCSSACSSLATKTPPGARRITGHCDQEANNAGCMRKLVSGSCNAVRHVGKRLPCSSLPPIRDDDNGDHSAGMLTPHGASIHGAPQMHAAETPKLEFRRVDISKRMRLVVEQLWANRRDVSKILKTLASSQNTGPHIAQSRPNTISESIETKLYGRDHIMSKIIHNITKGEYCDKNLIVIPIVGPGGIGKTTLAQHIYQHQEVHKHFQVMVWKCVSFNFNVDKLTQDIEKCVPPVQDEKIGTSGELIGQRLKSKRFLLVLDDIWECGDDNEWKRLLLPFKKSEIKGNIIIVTTRRPAVAKMVSRNPIELEGLDHEHFKELFLAFVFDDEQSRQDHAVLLDMGYKIMDKLKGSPLAAKTVGRLLRNNLDPHHWNRVLESKGWELQRGDNDIMPALQLSYDYLPFDLQQCFSYCALFPQDHKFDSKELIHFWIGQGILHSGDQNNLSDEDIGMRNINDLVSHGFLKEDETEWHRPCYVIHDLLHDLALKVASDEILSLHICSVISWEVRTSIRHLSIILDNNNGGDMMSNQSLKSQLRKLITRLKVRKLQSLMIFGVMDDGSASIFQDLFEEADALRLLLLPKINYPFLDSFLQNPSISIHLRYLRLGSQSSWSAQKFPSTLSRFYHLKILDLQKWFGRIDLPRDMSNLINLSHFLPNYDGLYTDISNVGKLQYLQQLKKFQVNKESSGFELSQLGNMTSLRELGIYNLERVHTEEEAIQAKLIDKNYLCKLTLVWRSTQPNAPHVDEALYIENLRPHSKLHELSIIGHGGPSCPTWLGDHISGALRSLHLQNIAWKSFPPLGRMWVLEELTLHSIPALKEFGPRNLGSITEQSFGRLKELRVINLRQLEHWVLEDTSPLLSQLQVLIIKDCPNLSGLPVNHILDPSKLAVEGTPSWFPNIQVLQVERCQKVVSLPPIPWTQTLRSVYIPDRLSYTKSTWVELELSGTYQLVLNNLEHLNKLTLNQCTNLEIKHLQMLPSLEDLSVCDSDHVFVSSEDEGEVRRQLPVRCLEVKKCNVKGKELTEFISCFPNLRSLRLIRNTYNYDQLTHMVVALEQQKTKKTSMTSRPAMLSFAPQPPYPWATAPDSCSRPEMSLYPPWSLCPADDDDGLMILPVNLRDSLEQLTIIESSHMLRIVTDHIDKKAPGGIKTGGLHTLHSLKELEIITILPPLPVNKNILPALKFLYVGMISFSSSHCPFPPSLWRLKLHGAGGMGTLLPLLNLTSLIELTLSDCGEDLRSDGPWHLVAQGQLRYLRVKGSPRFFLGSDPVGELQDEYQNQLLRHSSKLMVLETDGFGFLATPVCSILSSSLIVLHVESDNESERFTKEQEEAFQLLTSLQRLDFTLCEKLQCLPAGLHRLPNGP